MALSLPAVPERNPLERTLPLRTNVPEFTSTRFSSTTTLKYAQKPLPNPDTSGLEGFQLQFTLMPPTPADYQLNNPNKRRSQQLPYLLTVADDDVEEPFSPQSTNYSAPSEAGSKHDPFPRTESQFYSANEVVPKKPSTTSMIVLTGRDDPNAPNASTPPQSPRFKVQSLAERRAKKLSPLNPSRPTQNDPLVSPPLLTSRSAAHVEAGRLCTPHEVSKPDVSTPRSASFPVLSMPLPSPGRIPTPQSAGFQRLPTPQSASFFSPRQQKFPVYVPHSIISPRNVAFSPIHEEVDRETLKSPTGVDMLVKHAQECQDGFLSTFMPHTIRGMYEMLWQVANAQISLNETFDMTQFRQDSFTFTGAEHFTFGPDMSAPFYRLSAHPSHAQDAIFSDLKIHRCNPTTTIEVPVIHLQLEAPAVEASGVVALIYPQVAALMINEKEDMNQPKLDVGEEEECCRLVYEDGRGFALFHPFKNDEGRWLNINVEGRVGFDVVGANGRISIKSPSTHHESLVTLDFATSRLSVSAAACASVPSFYIVDVAVAAVLTVATVEGRRLRAIQEDLEQIMAYESGHSETDGHSIARATNSRSGSISIVVGGAAAAVASCVLPRTITPPSSVPTTEKPKALPLDYSFAAAMGRRSDERTGDGKSKQQRHQQQQQQPLTMKKKKSIASKLGKAFKGAVKSLNCKSTSSLQQQQSTGGASPDPALDDFHFQVQSFSFPPPPKHASR